MVTIPSHLNTFMIVKFKESYKYRNKWIPRGTRMEVVTSIERIAGLVYTLVDERRNYYFDIPAGYIFIDNSQTELYTSI